MCPLQEKKHCINEMEFLNVSICTLYITCKMEVIIAFYFFLIQTCSFHVSLTCMFIFKYLAVTCFLMNWFVTTSS